MAQKVGLTSRRVGTEDYSSAPLTEPDVRTSHPALWIGISERQRQLGRCRRRVEFVPAGLKRDHPPCEPGRWIGSRHCRPVRFHPCSFSAVRTAGGSFRADAFAFQVSEEEAVSLPLSDDNRPDPAADMRVNEAQPFDRFRRTEPEVGDPPGQVAADARHAGIDGSPPVRRRHLPYGGLQSSVRFSRGKHGDDIVAVPVE